MNKSKIQLVAASALGVMVIALGMGALYAQTAGIKRTLLMKADITVPGREVVMAQAEIPGGMSAGRHTHFGEEVGYILEGSSVIEIEGKPPLTVKAGDTYFIEAGKAHDAKVPANGSVKVLAVYIVEKGKPLATPAP